MTRFDVFRVQGGELFERVIDEDFVLTERSCACFMKQICEAMDYIHSNKVIHLDMKVKLFFRHVHPHLIKSFTARKCFMH